MMRLLLSGSGNVIPKETLLLKVWGMIPRRRITMWRFIFRS